MLPPRKWQAPEPRAGARPREAAEAWLQAALAQARANARGALEADDPEYLHQLRVGLRRYRSALRFFRHLLRRKPRRQAAKRASAVMRSLGEVRDWDVFVQRLKAARVAPGLLLRARVRRSAARESLRLDDLDRLRLQQDAWKKRGEPAALEELERQLRKTLRDIDWDDPAQRHRLRLRVKRLRYASEFAGGGSRALAGLQDSLGALNDLAVARVLLRELGASPDAEPRLFARERALVSRARAQARALQAGTRTRRAR